MMKNKVLKISLIILILVTVIVTGYYIYATIIAIGSQRMPVVTIPNELKNLEKEIQNETKGGSVYFYPIPKYELEDCNALINVDLSIRNDSITSSKELLDIYISSVNKRINERLVDKKCIDSLIIEVSSYYSKEKVDSLKSKNHRYSFPI